MVLRIRRLPRMLFAGLGSESRKCGQRPHLSGARGVGPANERAYNPTVLPINYGTDYAVSLQKSVVNYSKTQLGCTWLIG